MTAPLSPPEVITIHEAEPDRREPRTRRKLMFFDRVKVLIILAVVLGYVIALRHSQVPIMSWSDAAREQVEDKWWILVLAGIEVVRQIHNLMSEHWVRYHGFWTHHAWGRWNRFWDRRNPWLRFRLARLVRVTIWLVIVLYIFSAIWGVGFVTAIAEAPHHLLYEPFGDRGLPFFFQIFFSLAFGMFQFIGIFYLLSRGGIETFMPQDITTRFSDVYGQDKVLARVRENVMFLDKPEEIESKGGHVPGGILLWGPPGTGKTLMAEAVAGETGKPFVFVEPGAFINMFFGIGILKVALLFRRLRKLSLRYGGVIAFYDEADTLGNRGMTSGEFIRTRADELRLNSCNGTHYLSMNAQALLAEDLFASRPADDATTRRGGRFNLVMPGGMGGGGMGTLQRILTEMSGLKKPRGFVSRRLRAFLNIPPKAPPRYRMLSIFATNMPEALDAALLRPGRIDRKYHVGYPNLEGRIRTFEGYLDKIRHQVTSEQIEQMAIRTPSGSGALIKDMVNEALLVATRAGRDFVTFADMLEARTFKVHGLSDGTASTELERWETAIHEAGHAVATHLLRPRDVIDIATIEQRGAVGGFVAWIPKEDRKFDWRGDADIDLVCSIVSLAAEREFFGGDNSFGVGGDLAAATGLATRMLRRAAMGDTFSSPSVPSGFGIETGNELDQRVEAKLAERYAFAQELIREHRWFVLAIAHSLVLRSTILGDDIHAIRNGAKGVMVDGAWYHDPENQAALEAYHERALVAHAAQAVGFSGDIPPLPDVLPLPAPNIMDSGPGIGSTDQPGEVPSPLPVPPTEPG
ncbi:MAG: AAA family ATPase [Ilumatobacteraceae bacterium]